MKHLFLHNILLITTFLLCPTVLMSGEKTNGYMNEYDSNSFLSSKDKRQKFDTENYLKNVPAFEIRKLTLLNENGDTIRYEDGSIQYHYIMYDKEGNVCHPEMAQKLTNASLKSGFIGAGKIAAGVIAGIIAAKLVTKFFGKKKAVTYILAAVGGVAGLLWAQKDIKNIKEKTTLLKQYKAEINKYQTTFTDEGLPLEAKADLSDYNDCEELTQNALDIKDKLAESLADGMTIEELSDDELDKLEQENSKQIAQFDIESNDLIKLAEELKIQ